MLRPGGATAGLAGRCFSMLHTVRCAIEQLALRVCDQFQVWLMVVRPSRALALQLLQKPQCLLDEWSRCFLAKYNTPELLLAPLARAFFCLHGRVCSV